MKSRILYALTLWLASLFAVSSAAVQTAVAQSQPVVQAILFYSPTCPHCHAVINETLLPMQEEYGDQLQILGVDTSQQAGDALYKKAVEFFEIPSERLGVPTLIIADTILVGDQEIPARFPALVDAGLAAGGIGWPAIPDLAEDVPGLAKSAEPDPTSEMTANSSATTSTGIKDLETAVTGSPPPLTAETMSVPMAVEGSELAWAVMFFMIAALLYSAYRLPTTTLKTTPPIAAQTGVAFALIAVGLVVSGYLAYVEMTRVTAVCGPVGDCNTVQSSSYAQILGIPIALLGALNYVTVGLLWLAQRLENNRGQWAKRGLLALTIFGALFSVYLTALELFVIHAVCAWCLTSAIVTTLLMILSIEATKRKV